jgi:hypothetical protein
MKQYIYTVKGTISGSRCYEDYTEWMTPEELADYEEEISTLFLRDSEDELAQYIHKSGYRDAMLYGVVTEIWVGVKNIDGTLYSWTEVTANRELTEIEKDALLDYLTGQFSDGYGEGLEQQAFNSYTEIVEEEDWDEETQETYMYAYDVQVDMYLHLWQPNDFNLEFVEIDPDLKYAVEEGLITENELYEAQNITFNISSEDYGLFLSQIKKYIPIKEIKSVSYFELEERGKYDGAYKVIDVNGNIRIFGWIDFRYGLDELKGLIKPRCKLTGEDGNIFNLIGIAARALRHAGLADKATEMSQRVMQSQSYTEALSIIMEYVEVE